MMLQNDKERGILFFIVALVALTMFMARRDDYLFLGGGIANIVIGAYFMIRYFKRKP